MSDEEDRTEQAIYRAGQVEALLRNEALTDAFDYLDAQYTQAWRTSRTLADREICWHRINALGNVRDHLTKVISDGKLAQADLNIRILRKRA